MLNGVRAFGRTMLHMIGERAGFPNTWSRKGKESAMKTTNKRILATLLALLLALGLTACAKQTPAQNEPTQAPAETPNETPEAPEPTPDATEEDVDGELILDHEEELQYANQFTLTHYKGGYKKFTVASAADKEFLLVPEGKSVPEGLAENVVVLQQPLTKICMCSTGMVSLVDAIGGLDSVATVGTEAIGWYIENVVERMESGAIQFSGKYSEPDYEMLTAAGIQLEVDTTMLNNCPEVMEKYDELGIPYFVESSSKEGHPLGRVEWVKLFGAILGLEDEANAYFAAQAEKVEAVVTSEKAGKTVAMCYISSSSDKVYARNGGDYMAAMIGMAGGDYIMADVEPEKTGNSAITFEEFYARCIDADYIFYVNFALKFSSIEELIAYNPLFGDFQAVQNGNFYITAPDFTQSTAAIGGIIEDMHTVLNDASIETTDSLIKLK